MKSRFKCVNRWLVTAAGALALGVGVAQASPIVLLNDDFGDGELTNPQWRNGNGSSGTNTSGWTVVADPTDPGNTVLKSDPVARTHSANVTGTLGGGQELVTTRRFNKDQANTGWNSQFHLLISAGNSEPSGGDGYVAYIDGGVANNLRIRRFDSFTSATTLAQGAVALTSGWNTMEFRWKPSGGLSLSVNGLTPLTVTDTTYATQFARVMISNFLNNSSDGISITGRVLLYDDVKVEAIPEPASLGLLGLSGFLILGSRRASAFKSSTKHRCT